MCVGSGGWWWGGGGVGAVLHLRDWMSKVITRDRIHPR